MGKRRSNGRTKKQSWWTQPQAIGSLPEGTAERLAAKVIPGGSDGTCLEFTGCVVRKGYGQMKVAGKPQYTHRVAYALRHGSVPAAMTIDHVCRNTVCCNPDHLQLMTNEENVEQQLLAKRAAQADECDMALQTWLDELCTPVPWLATG